MKAHAITGDDIGFALENQPSVKTGI